jgi:hypothetical protein
MKEFRIQIRGRGTDRGIGTITQAQYEYWSDEDNEDDLGSALNDDYDYEEHDAPESVVLHDYYNEYEDVGFFTGPDDSGSYVTISGPDGDVFDGSLDDFLTETHGDDDSVFDAMEEVVEMYMNEDCLDPGYYVVWAQGGKGNYFEGSFDAETFNPKLLKFRTTDFEGNGMITEVLYADEPVENSGGDWRGQWADYRVVEISE